jgi:aminomethyltransferase
MWTVRKTMGPNPYIGNQAVEKAKTGGVKEKRVGFTMEGNGIARDGTEVLDGSGKTVGKVTSGTFSPLLKKGVGMAYINTECSKVSGTRFTCLIS